MNSKKIIFMLLIVLACLTGCRSNSNKESMKTDNTPTTEYVYITYTLDKEYKIGLDENFSAKDIGQFDEKFRNVNLIELTKYIIEDNKQYLEGNNTMTVYVDTDKVSYYSQCIVQIASLINSSYSSYKVEYLNLPKENTANNANSNEQGNQNKPSTNNNSNNNSNSSNNTNTQSGSNTSSGAGNSNSGERQMILPTISYVCSSGYEFKDGKCIKETIYNATKQPTCPDGYNYDESKSKCLKKISKPPTDIVSCNNGYPIKDGEAELNGSGPGYCLLSEEMQDAYYNSEVYDECPSLYGKHCTGFYSLDYIHSIPTISCPEGSILGKTSDSLGDYIYCQDENNHYIEPTSVLCGAGEELKGDRFAYYCEKEKYTLIGYRVRFCPDGKTLIKYNGEWDKCALVEPLNYGIYCNENNGEEMIGGECISYQEQAPITKYQCDSGDKNYNTSQCIHVESVATTPKYSCPNKYVLTVEYMCIER